jgi:hypothetical protein
MFYLLEEELHLNTKRNSWEGLQMATFLQMLAGMLCAASSIIVV